MPEQNGKHILGTFDNLLQSLRNNVLMMASLAERNLGNATKGLFERDDDHCNIAIADDEEIDLLEIQIDRDGVELLLRFQPVASDLRQVITAMKSSVNIERIADQSVNIARRARKLNATEALPLAHNLEPLFSHAAAMFRDAVNAYADDNLALARSLKPRDKELDRMNHEFAELCTQQMAANPHQVQAYLNLIFIARFLERIGDHATNFGEDVVFSISSEEIRHTQASPGN
jgi:phosphate transport system protein